MNQATGAGVALTERLHQLVTSQAKAQGISMEALAHAVLVLSLTDADMTQRSVELTPVISGTSGLHALSKRDFELAPAGAVLWKG